MPTVVESITLRQMLLSQFKLIDHVSCMQDTFGTANNVSHVHRLAAAEVPPPHVVTGSGH